MNRSQEWQVKQLKKTSYLAIGGLVLFLAFGIWYFVREEPLPVKQPEQASPASLPGITFSGSSVVEQQDGKTLWDLTADTIEMSSDSKTMRFVNPKGIYYETKEGKIEITGLRATMDTKTRDIVMEGNVKAVNSAGATFTADTIKYFSKDKKFFGTGNVVVTKEDTVATGDQIESDNNMEKIILKGKARVVKGGQKP